MEILPHKILAAVDLGSNSFHLGLAAWEHGQLTIKTKLREKIQLAAGLDEDNHLSEEAQARALTCLQQFGEYIRDLPSSHVRIVGTNTFREAHHVESFLAKAYQVLGHPIEIITGQEEARLIYLGVTQSRAIPEEKLLVLDIGGGSSEIIIGEKGHPEWLKSISIGCVSFTKRFFPEGKNDSHAFQAALQAAKEAFAMIKAEVQATQWKVAWGTSGTVDAVASVLQAHDASHEGITPQRLEKLQHLLSSFSRTQDIELPGLRPDRATIFPAGVAILSAACEVFEISNMTVAGAALREGLLFELVEKLALRTS